MKYRIIFYFVCSWVVFGIGHLTWLIMELSINNERLFDVLYPLYCWCMNKSWRLFVLSGKHRFGPWSVSDL